MTVLKYWDDPDHLFNQYMRRLELNEKKQMLKRDQLEKKMLGFSDSKAGIGRGSIGGSVKSLKGLKQSTSAGRYSTALMPVVENAANLRAMQEIETIKQSLKDKEA